MVNHLACGDVLVEGLATRTLEHFLRPKNVGEIDTQRQGSVDDSGRGDCFEVWIRVDNDA